MSARFPPLQYLLSISLAAAVVLVLCYVLVVGSAPDDEEFRFAVLSAWLRARGPWTMDAAFWTPLLGLGVPQPFVPSFSHHLLAPLLAWMPPIAWVRLLIVAHTVVGAIGMWRLGTTLGLPPIVQATNVATFLLAAPVQNYLLIDFWPSHHVAWTLLPWMMLMAWRVLDSGTSGSGARRCAGGLSLLCGIVATNANPAYLVVFTPLAVAILMRRPSWRRLGWIVIAAVITAAIATPVVVQLATERSYFGDHGLLNIQDPLPPRAAWLAFAYPFVPEPFMRILFFGGPYTALALAGCVWRARRHIDLVLGFLVSGMLLFTTWVPMPLVSQRYQFRDPVTFCGILLASLVLARILAQPRSHRLGNIVIAVQLLVIAGGATPAVRRALADGAMGAVRFYGATADTAVIDRLVEQMPSRGRLLYSPRVSVQMVERTVAIIDGLGPNALAYRGIPVVNGWFKGVSTDPIWPDYSLFYGQIVTPEQLFTSDAGLDVLAIRYALAYHDEPVSPGLRPLTRVTTSRGGELVLYENPDPWPTAFLVQASFGNNEVPVFEGCDNDRVLCRDLRGIAAHRDPTPIEVTRAEDHIRIDMAPMSGTAVLVVSEMFRPGWTAIADGRRPLAIRSILGGLLGIPLPAGAREVELHYRPRAHRIASVVSLGGLLVGIGLIVARRRGTNST